MKATFIWLGALFAVAATGAVAQAGILFHHCAAPCPCNAFGCAFICAAPNSFGPGCCEPLCNGAFCHPAPFPLVPGQQLGGGPPGNGNAGGFAVHPFARSPRDYFMYADP